MRVTLFTDTLGDVNGVCRFIQNVAGVAQRTGRDLHVITSTRFVTPARPNIFNFVPRLSCRLPGYPQLEIALPPVMQIVRHLRRHPPDVIHVSTPGPVGLVGRLAARTLGVPLLGVYHTDFPAYVENLFDDGALTWITHRTMRAFYAPFDRVFTRSESGAGALLEMGIGPDRVAPLSPGVDTSTFSPRARDPSIWARLGATGAAVKVLYVGRVSVEKNLLLLARAWRMAEQRLGGEQAALIVVGDGPYRAAMEDELRGTSSRFLGFRHGAELSAIYASSDLFVFPSVTDTLGQVVMEAQASGLPVLVSDRGGPRTVVRNDVTGMVLPGTSPRAWADQIVGLVRDGGQRRRMGAAASASMMSATIESSFDRFWTTHEAAARGTRRSAWSRIRATDHNAAAACAARP